MKKYNDFTIRICDMIYYNPRFKFVKKIGLLWRKYNLKKLFSKLDYDTLMNFGNAINTLEKMNILEEINSKFITVHQYSSDEFIPDGIIITKFDIKLYENIDDLKDFDSIIIKVSSLNKDVIDCQYILRNKQKNNTIYNDNKLNELSFTRTFQGGLKGNDYNQNDSTTYYTIECMILGFDILFDNLINKLMEV